MNDVDSNATISTENPETIQEETSKPTLSGNIEDYKLVIDLTREMKNSLNDAREQVQASLKNKGYVAPDVLEDMVILSSDDIETGDIEKLRSYIKDHLSDPNSYDDKFGSKSDDDIRESVREIRKTFVFVHTIEKEYHDIIRDSKDILEEYFNYVGSARVEDSLRKRLDIMKSMEEIDETTSAKNKRKIEMLEKTLDFSFITDNLNVDRVAETFFKDNLSSYVVSKFEAKIKRYGYNNTIYTHFFDIEENFLDEKYHPFNNLFLFIYMRYVGHTDPYMESNGLYVRSITGALGNLIYHRFDTTDHEKDFLKFIESILDKFIEAGYTDQFIMDNTSYKNNEANIRARQAMEEQKRDLVIKKLKYYNIEYSEDMTLDELMELFDDNYNELEGKILDEEKDDDTQNIIADTEDHFKVDDINAAIDSIKNAGFTDDEEATEDIKEETSYERFEDEQDEAVDEPSVESEQDGSGDNSESEPEEC